MKSRYRPRSAASFCPGTVGAFDTIAESAELIGLPSFPRNSSEPLREPEEFGGKGAVPVGADDTEDTKMQASHGRSTIELPNIVLSYLYAHNRMSLSERQKLYLKTISTNKYQRASTSRATSRYIRIQEPAQLSGPGPFPFHTGMAIAYAYTLFSLSMATTPEELGRETTEQTSLLRGICRYLVPMVKECTKGCFVP